MKLEPKHEPAQDPMAAIRSARAAAEELHDFQREAAKLDYSPFVRPPIDAIPPEALPGYQLLREIGSGGQGIVYEAVQISANRKVAIKLLPHGWRGGSKVRDRFGRELRALCHLRHPNIVAMHDAGATDQFSWLAMDYVDGESIERYVEMNKLSPRETMALFLKVCEAVNAAHLKGITHRDLKPANILVDRHGEPFVVDFGLAKILEESNSSEGDLPSQLTVTEQFVGTTAWASPEQVERDPEKIDIRTDVYSLGVVLYRLLTGSMPYDTSGGTNRTNQQICHAAPKPPRLIRRELDNESETIVLKSLAKERGRRYQGAGALAEDIRRYLSGLAIEAKRDSVAYVFGRFLRRNRLVASLTLAFVVALGTSLFALGSAVSEREFAREREADQARLARLEAESAEYVTSIPKEVLGVALKSATPDERAELLDTLDNRVRQLDENDNLDAVIKYRMRLSLADCYFVACEYEKVLTQRLAALDDANKAYGIGSDPAVYALILYGGTQSVMEDHARAHETFESARKLLHEKYGSDSQRLTYVIGQLGSVSREQKEFISAEYLIREAIRIMRSDKEGDRLLLASALKGYAEMLSDDLERFEEAEALQREALQILADAGSTDSEFAAHHYHSFSVLLEKMDLLDEALKMAQRAYKIRREITPLTNQQACHRDISRFQVGSVLLSLGRFEEAEDELLGAFDSYEPIADRNFLPIKPRMTKRIAQLYEEWDEAEPEKGHAQEALKWREQLRSAHEPP